MTRRRNYPRIGEDDPVKRPIECRACAKDATHQIRVQFDYMRGDDEIYSVCDLHAEFLRTGRFSKFFNDLEIKNV